MMNRERAVTSYIRQVTGENLPLSQIRPKALSSLPLYLADTWTLKTMNFLGQELVFAFPKEDERKGLSRLIKDGTALGTYLHKHIVLVLPHIQSYERRELIKKRVSFVTPGRQIFLPVLFNDFRESFSSFPEAPKESVSWIAQLILLRHLVKGDVEGRPQTEIARLLDYTAMAISKGIGELVSLKLGEKLTQGRSRTVNFKIPPEELWNRALSHLRSPVIRRYPVIKIHEKIVDFPWAGLSALTEKSALSYANPGVKASDNRQVKRLITDHIFEVCPHEDNVDQILEGWAYSPSLLSNNHTVDDLSLYLSLKDDRDERVQIALQTMMESRTW